MSKEERTVWLKDYFMSYPDRKSVTIQDLQDYADEMLALAADEERRMRWENEHPEEAAYERWND